MAWIKMKTSTGVELSVPESVYKNLYANNDAFTLVQESKPAPNKKEENKKVEEKEIVNNEQTQRPIRDEDNSNRKSTKKVG